MKCSTYAFVVSIVISGLSKAEQPYIVIAEGAGCFDGLKETAISCDLKLIGRKRLLNGTFTIREDMASDHFRFQVELYNSPNGDNQYKRLAIGTPIIGICEGFKEYYAQMVEPSVKPGINSNFPSMPKEGLCPFPKGEHFIKNVELDTESWPNPVPHGFLKVVVTFFKDGENVGGAEVGVRIEDRK